MGEDPLSVLIQIFKYLFIKPAQSGGFPSSLEIGHCCCTVAFVGPVTILRLFGKGEYPHDSRSCNCGTLLSRHDPGGTLF